MRHTLTKILDGGAYACSFDKGFHPPDNQNVLKEQLEHVVLPRKGKLSQQAIEAEQTESFIKARHAHSAVESAINALEVHGLDKCPDHGIDGFKRYVAFAVVKRNIHRIGDILWKREQEREQRKKKKNAGCCSQLMPSSPLFDIGFLCPWIISGRMAQDYLGLSDEDMSDITEESFVELEEIKAYR